MGPPRTLNRIMSTPENPPPPGGDEPGRGLSGGQRWLIVLGALAVLLVVFVVLQGGDDSGNDSSSSSSAQTTAASSTSASSASTSTAQSTESTSTTDEDESESETGSTSTSDSTSTSGSTVPASQTINVVNGQPQGGVKTVSFEKNDQVVLKVNSDVADEIHVHGYDLMKDVEKGGSVTFNFKATIEGRFEVELEDAGTQIANLEVTPR
jgi:cytoskeletal protein RodZ